MRYVDPSVGPRRIHRRYFPRYVGGPADGQAVPAELLDRVSIRVPIHVPTAWRPPVEADEALSGQAMGEVLYNQHTFAMGSSNHVLVLWAESSLSGEEACSRVWRNMLSAVGA